MSVAEKTTRTCKNTVAENKSKSMYETIQEHLAKAKKTLDRSQDQYFSEAASFGDQFRQGDVYLTLIPGVPEDTFKKMEKPVSQLAEGNTAGSRHCLVAVDMDASVKLEDLVEMWEPKTKHALCGNIFKTKQQVRLNHPQHGDCILPAGMCFGVTFQVQHDKELRRVRD